MLSVALKIIDPRLTEWGFPHYGSDHAAGLDLHACIDAPLTVRPQAPAVLISAGFAVHIGDPDWCALVLPRSGLGHREGLVLGNAVGLIDADYQGTCMISAWNRNPTPNGRKGDTDGIVIRPGDRVAQLIFTRVERPQFTVVEEFTTATSREKDGFGSTGISSSCRKGVARRNC
jgi:dUTP pyrophosphatase